MKTQQIIVSAPSAPSKRIKFSPARAGARAAINYALGLVSPGEVGRLSGARFGPRGWSISPVFRPSSVIRNLGARGGVLSPMEAAQAQEWLASRVACSDFEATMAAMGAEFDQGAAGSAMREVGRLVRWGALVGVCVEVAAGGVSRPMGAGLVNPERLAMEAARATAERVATCSALDLRDNQRAEMAAEIEAEIERAGVTPSAPLGGSVRDDERRQIERLARVVAAGAREDLPPAEAAAALAAAESELATLRAAQIRARAALILRDGLRGRASARARRIGRASGMRWLRKNSRREALALAEVGGAGGVDDLGAGADWAAELMAISTDCHLRAVDGGLVALAEAAELRAGKGAAGGAAGGALDHPCEALGLKITEWRELVESLAGMDPRAAQNYVFARGRRVDGLPVGEWTNKGRTVRADSVGIIGRGVAWVGASKVAGRAMSSARYGRGGRDGREVAANWRLNGTIDGGGAGAALWQVAPTRRPSVVQSARDSLALAIWSARVGVERARRVAMAAESPGERKAAGSALGVARRNLAAAASRAEWFGVAMRGGAIPSNILAGWMDIDDKGKRLTEAGKKLAQRLSKSLWQSVAAVPAVDRAGWPVGVEIGDEVAHGRTVAPYSV